MRYVLPRLESIPFWTSVAAPIFFLLFIGIVFWTYKRSRRKTYEETATLPLNDGIELHEEEHGRRG